MHKLARFLEKLQNQPKSTKYLVLWSTTALIMILIVTGWATSLQKRVRTVAVGPSVKQQEQTNVKKIGGIWGDFKNDFASLFQNLENITKKSSSDKEPVGTSSVATSTDKSKRLNSYYKLPISNQK